MKMKNPTLEEIRETRERLLRESGGTLAGLVERLQAEERASGRTMRERRRVNGIARVPNAACSEAVCSDEEHSRAGS